MTTRIAALDVLRGTAILGTLATNIWIFTDPEGLPGYLAGTTRLTTPAVWGAVEVVLQQLAQGKFLGLLTLLFGVGLELQRRSAVRAGRPWPGRYPVRAGLLFLDGVLHYLLVVEFDVLMGYAVTGAVVAYVLATSERAQRTWMLAAAAVHLLLLAAAGTALALAPQPAAGGPVLDHNPYADGSWLDLVRFRVAAAGLFRLEPVFLLALGVAMFLLGAGLLRSGVLAPEGAALRRRLLVLAAVALPGDLALGIAGGDAGVVLARYGTAPLVALGLLAAVTELVARRERRARAAGLLERRVADVGRTALSCYVLQNLVASAVCYGWGLGLAARLDAAARVPATVALHLVVSAVVVAFAALWLRRWDRGPLELAWDAAFRALTGPAPAPVDVVGGRR
jgi:uncharacterized protein